MADDTRMLSVEGDLGILIHRLDELQAEVASQRADLGAALARIGTLDAQVSLLRGPQTRR